MKGSRIMNHDSIINNACSTLPSMDSVVSVSYTHLDVYKRQTWAMSMGRWKKCTADIAS